MKSLYNDLSDRLIATVYYFDSTRSQDALPKVDCSNWITKLSS